jgi:hypothetical protein
MKFKTKIINTHFPYEAFAESLGLVGVLFLEFCDAESLGLELDLAFKLPLLTEFRVASTAPFKGALKVFFKDISINPRLISSLCDLNIFPPILTETLQGPLDPINTRYFKFSTFYLL